MNLIRAPFFNIYDLFLALRNACSFSFSQQNMISNGCSAFFIERIVMSILTSQ